MRKREKERERERGGGIELMMSNIPPSMITFGG